MNLRAILAFISLLAAPLLAQVPDTARLKIMAEALSRMQPEQVAANPKLKEALDQVLAGTRGTPEFVRLVQKFSITGQEEALLAFAQKNPAEELGVAAIRLVLAPKSEPLLKGALAGPDAAKTIEALGNSNHRRAAPLLLDVMNDAKRDAALRQQSVRALAQLQDGAKELLALAKAGKLSAELRDTAGASLKEARWSPIRDEAASVFASKSSGTVSNAPTIAELMKLKGDATNGAKIFRRETVGCIKCHQINGEGVDFGPALSEIGTKLGRDAIYQSILEPSAGISFGFEAWSLELKNGDELYGLITSETETDVTLKDARAVATKVGKPDIAKRTQSKLSIMPDGLAKLMTTQELVDVVEYLSTLKKK
ncbi:MAG: c-type cytochrome [Verrucomicrobia bacterium]|nr:c-type cytochrome [Verrucomicrobiota bacterium]